MRQSDVTFRKNGEMDIIEISYPDGKVAGFPAESVSPETGLRYCDMYQKKYQAFKSGDTTEREAQLKSEIAQRQAELDGMKKDSEHRSPHQDPPLSEYVKSAGYPKDDGDVVKSKSATRKAHA